MVSTLAKLGISLVLAGKERVRMNRGYFPSSEALLMFKRCMGTSMLLSLLFLLGACGSTVTMVAAPVTTPEATVTTAMASPTTTLAPTPGVCSPTDFPVKLTDAPDPTLGHAAPGFAYPPLTYHSQQDGAAGTYRYFLCSSGTPDAILAFMAHSIAAAGWKVTATTASTLNAVQVNLPQEGLCASVNLAVGTHPGYPGEWDEYFHSPTASCTP